MWTHPSFALLNTALCFFHCFKISTHLNGGYRMSPPPGCSRGIYKLMIKCWLVYVHTHTHTTHARTHTHTHTQTRTHTHTHTPHTHTHACAHTLHVTSCIPSAGILTQRSAPPLGWCTEPSRSRGWLCWPWTVLPSDLALSTQMRMSLGHLWLQEKACTETYKLHIADNLESCVQTC